MVLDGTISSKSSKQSLYERLGGDQFMETFICSLFDEWRETSELEPFFVDAPIETLKTHHVKFFRLIFGSKQYYPESDDLFYYVILTHTRLFRDFGLNVTHFDLVIEGFVQVLESLSINQKLIDEVTARLLPYRDIFEYGAQLAQKEKEMDHDTFTSLPQCSRKCMGTDTPVVLPTLPSSTNPPWLELELENISSGKSLRNWTSCLSDRCSKGGDKYLADCLMDLPYPKLEPYMIALVTLAVVPSSTNDHDTIVKDTLQLLRYPRGQNKDALSRCLYERLIVQFGKACDILDVKSSDTKLLMSKLGGYSTDFTNIDPPKIYGITNPHVLSKTKNVKSFQLDTSNMSPKKGRSQSFVAMTRIDIDDEDTITPSVASSSTMGAATNTAKNIDRMKNGIRKLLGKAA